MPIDPSFEAALRSADPFASLRALAVRRIAGGEEPSIVLDSFEGVRSQLRELDREADEDAVMDVMDLLTGFCSPHMTLDRVTPSAFEGLAPTGEIRDVGPNMPLEKKRI